MTLLDATLTICTGYEGKGICYWCGGELKSKRQKSFCSNEHRKEYYRHFDWATASKWCKQRANYKCQDCGIDASKIPTVAPNSKYGGTSGYCVHHIIEVQGGSRWFNPLNAPCNLLALCHDCHMKWHHWNKNKHNLKLQIIMDEIK
jgi:hypothetical protein